MVDFKSVSSILPQNLGHVQTSVQEKLAAKAQGKERMRTGILPIALIALAGSAQGQSIEMLGSLGGSGSIARDINDLGQIVGESLLAGDVVSHATIWNNGIASDLGGLSAGDNSVAWAINNLGVAVGSNDLSTGERTAALFQGGSVTNLGATIGSQGNSVAWDINDAGVVVGQAPINPGFAKGFVWDATNGAQAAGTIPGYMGGANKAINNSGTIVGHSFFFGDPDNATLATPDGRGGYDAFSIGPAGFNVSFATAISDSGIVVGHTNGGGAGGPTGGWQAVIYEPDGQGGTNYVPLGFLDGLSISEATDVNDDGLVVGFGLDGDGLGILPRAFAWHNGVMTDLNDLLTPDSDFVNLTQATGVNAHGDIVGFGETRSGELAGFVIKGFVPAPGTGVLLAAAGLMASRRRRDNH